MIVRKPLVAGNWKMHGSRASNAALVGGIAAGLARNAPLAARCDVAIFPTFVHLESVAALAAATPIAWGAQDCCAEPGPGAYTGEVAASSLQELGCRYVLVGHSERRALYGESDELVARKFVAAQAAGLVPVLCVGETLAERDRDETHAVVARQLSAVLERAGVAALARAVVAYEPVWAIGTGRTATPAQAQDVHAFIRGRIAALDGSIAGSVRLLYGGSVKASNAHELCSMPDVDGGLVGGASLNAEEFVAIVAAAARK